MNQAAQVGERGAAPEPPRQDSRKGIYAAIVAHLGMQDARLHRHRHRRSARKPDRKHPFGYGKTLYFWALIVALSVFSLGGGLSIYHGVAALQDPPPLEDPLWNYVVLGAAALFEGYSWNVSRKALNAKRGPGMTLWQTVRASKDASVFTVFIEDSAALLGIAIAAAGIAVGHYLDNPYADPVTSILIGLLLVGAAVTLARETGGLLVGEGIDGAQLESLRALFLREPALESVESLRTMQLGPEEVLLAASVKFRRGLQIGEVEQAIARIETAIGAANPVVRHVYFEASGLRSALR